MAEAAPRPQEAPQEGPQVETAPDMSEEAKEQADAQAQEAQEQISALKAEGQAAETAAQSDMDRTVEEMKAGNLDTDSSPDVVIKTDLVAQAEADLKAAGISTEDLATGKVGFFKKLKNRKAIKAWEAASAAQYDSLDKTAEVSSAAKTRQAGKSGGGTPPPMGLS